MVWDQQGATSLLYASVTAAGPLHFHLYQGINFTKNAQQCLADLEIRTK